MTTRASTTASNSMKVGFRLPDPPEREPDEATAFDYVYERGTSAYLAIHLGNPETTLVKADRWMVASVESNLAQARRPDLVVAFGVSRKKYEENNGYISSEQGKPPDFVLEVASISTAESDLKEKRDYYESMEIPEYWRFDHTGEFYGAKLAGDRLVDGKYEAIPIATLSANVLQGYSPTLNLHLRWEDGELEFIDPATGNPILTYHDQLARAEEAQARAEAYADLQRQAEERIRELEEENRRLRNRLK